VEVDGPAAEQPVRDLVLAEHAVKTGKRSELLCCGYRLMLAELVAVAREFHWVLLG
jgi:hypothetical protein